MNKFDYNTPSSTTSLEPLPSSPSARNRHQNTFSTSSDFHSYPSSTGLDDGKHERRSFLPSFNPTVRINGPLSFTTRIWNRVLVRSGKIRWFGLIFLFVFMGYLYSTRRRGMENQLKEAQTTLDKVSSSEDKVRAAIDSGVDQVSSPISSSTTSTIPDLSPIDVDVHPLSIPAPHVPILPFEKFLAYTPHSGYHNQRISLENALTLSFMLNRTLLLPPVWLGHAIPYISFDKLQHRVQLATKFGLERCKLFGEGGTEDIIPRECEGFFDWTLVGWEFLVDLTKVNEKVKIRNRWDLTSQWLREELEFSNLSSSKNQDGTNEQEVFYMKDAMMYEYRFYDSLEDTEPLGKFVKRNDIATLREISDPYRLLHIGSLFGTSRIRVTEEKNFDARSLFRKAMVFRNALIDEITEEIKDRLGGSGNYYGLHLRVGDGVFHTNVKENMISIWQQLCVEKMKIEKGICDMLRSKYSFEKRFEGVVEPSLSKFSKRASNSRPQREGAYHHASLPPLPVVKDRSNSLLHSSLTCRSSLHTSPSLLPFNIPLFIATDSKVPTSDPNLSIFFDAFPCTFILNDFGSISSLNSLAVPGLNRLSRLRNLDDFVPLAQFLYPQLDAGIAAYGRSLIGTPLSTYSRFAIDVLHQVYHGWEIIERG